MKLPLIKQDKANHFIYGGVIWIAIYFVVSFALAKPYNGLVALVGTVAVGVAKEFCDYIQNEKAKEIGLKPDHGVDEWDAFATALGGAFLWISYLAIGGVHGQG